MIDVIGLGRGIEAHGVPDRGQTPRRADRVRGGTGNIEVDIDEARRRVDFLNRGSERAFLERRLADSIPYRAIFVIRRGVDDEAQRLGRKIWRTMLAADKERTREKS
ncbi:protein of unknown function [uncultured Woeseiaceae bacterium]|uniref:Uncharacterized protein n=1 Tax=uncultured Woeseiaceae bacterium TaxID=1983305 RepID=A0A7D9D196_9GAMM|nr:protein of unknown function [uncultured Woeseiaceae bacterium]